MTWCHHHQVTLRARHIPGCLNVMADLLSRLNQVQSTEWSLHPQVFKQISQKWFTTLSKVVYFTCRSICHLSETQVPLYIIIFSPSHGFPLQVHSKIRQSNCLILIAPSLPGIPWFWDLVQLSTEIPLQLPVSTTLLNKNHLKKIWWNFPLRL